MLVEETSWADLFVEEDREVRAHVAAWLASHTPWAIVPPAELEAVRVRAVEGRDLATGALCGAPIHAHDAYERAFGTSDTATVAVECENGCELTVTVDRHPPGLSCGLTFLGLVDDLTVRAAPARTDAPTLGDCYVAMRAGELDLQTSYGRASFGLAMLGQYAP